MTKTRNLSVASMIAALGLSTVAATASYAQAPARANPPAAAAERRAPPTREAIAQRMAERRAQHAKDLSTVLRLTPAQQPALEAFLARRAPPANAGGPTRDRDAQTTPQRLDEQARRGDAMRARQAQRTEAVRTFYNQLTPDQKQVFDALQRLKGPEGRGRGGRFHGPNHGKPMGHRGPPGVYVR